VKTKVTEQNVTQFKPLIVADARLSSSNSWAYQLEDKDGILQDGGKWFAEVNVKPRTT
jgi:hypothetical protein